MARAGLDADALEAWIAAGWLRPQRRAGARCFIEMDVARAQLIRTLKTDLGINDEGVDVTLNLIDQLYGLRRVLRELILAFEAQPAEMRAGVAAELRSNGVFRSTAARNSRSDGNGPERS
jgi:chaperone modulatory protein CbpM